jgi:C_GCAxxG_C_C family probable redox protein
MGLQGEVCGALTGAVLVVGLIHGRDQADDQRAKEAAHTKAGEFVQQFAKVNGAVRCRDLIGLDVCGEEGLQAYYARNLQAERCNGIVTNAVRTLLELLHEWEASYV